MHRHMHVHYEKKACGELMDVTDWSFSCLIKISLWDMGGGFRGDNSEHERHAMNRQLYGLIQRQGPNDYAANPVEWISIPGGI